MNRETLEQIKVLLLVILLTHLSNQAIAQNFNKPFSITEAIPPSPNASAFAKFGEIPVNLYAGTVGIDIPIWNIKGRDLSFPISLSYHSSGIKVQEDASWVGLGWNINSGGSITRIVKGLPDENAQNRYDSYTDIGSLYNDQDFLLGVNSKLYDGEPDIFVYNVFGQTGKFILYQDTAYFLSHRDVVVSTTPYGNSMTFKITSDNGTVFEFGTAGMESTEYNTGDQMQDYISAWFLTKVTSANGQETIDFTYQDEVINRNHIIGRTVLKPFWNSHSICGTTTFSNQNSNSTTSAKRLLSIETIREKMIFEAQTSARLDLGITGTTSKALDHIDIYDKAENRLIKTFNFVYLPLQVISSSQQRLTLDKVVETAGGTSLNYTLQYESLSLPSKESFAIDHWGYYNGKSNTSYIPETLIAGAGEEYLGDADREPDESYKKAGVLTKIIYPTGGWSELEYESNKYDMLQKRTVPVIHNVNAAGYTSYTQVKQVDTFELTVPEGSSERRVRVEYNLSVPGGPHEVDYQSSFALYKVEGGVDELIVGAGISQGIISGVRFPYLEPGDYRIEAISWIESAYAEGSVSWDEEIEEYDLVTKLGPGLRIKSIVSDPGMEGATTLRKNYTYLNDTGGSSGIFIGEQPLYHSSSFSQLTFLSEGAVQCKDCKYDIVSSSMISSVHPAPDYEFVYDQVIETRGGSETNGKTTYEFIIAENNEILPERTTHYKYTSGDFEPLEVVENQYTAVTDRTFDAITIANVDSYECNNPHLEIRSDKYIVKSIWNYTTNEQRKNFSNGIEFLTEKIYEYGSNHRYPKSIEKLNSDGTRQLSIYKFPNDYAGVADFLIAKNIKNMAIEEQIWKGAISLTMVSGSIVEYDATHLKPVRDYMLEINSPISACNNETMSSGKYTTLLSDSRYKLNNNYFYDNTTSVLVQQDKSDGLSTAIQWGFNGTLPLMTASNAKANQVYFNGFENGSGTISSVARTGEKVFSGDYSFSQPSGLQVLSTTKLSYWYYSNDAWVYKEIPYSGGTVSLNDGDLIDDVRVFPALSIITTYTYKTGIGISSITDTNNITTYYEYDSFGRLQNEKDKNKNLQRNINYKYKTN